MEEQTVTAAPHPAPPAVPGPVMDVKPPQASSTAALAPEPVAVEPAPRAEDDKDINPPRSNQAAKDAPKGPFKDAAKNSAGTKKPPGNNGVGMAIAATVIIVLGLAALATYAFLKSQG